MPGKLGWGFLVLATAAVLALGLNHGPGVGTDAAPSSPPSPPSSSPASPTPTATSPVAQPGGPGGGSTVTDLITFDAFSDNTPPGRSIAHPCRHNLAGGTGSFKNPVTFAEPNDLRGPWCQVIYVPFLKKYFIHEDQCQPCGGVNTHHVDIWMGGNVASTLAPEKGALSKCENTWTRRAPVILNPPPGEPVDPTPLFTPPVTCHGGLGDSG